MEQIEQLAQHFQVSSEEIIGHRIDGGEVAVALVNYGIGGIKRLRVSVSDLPASKTEAEEPVAPELDATEGALELIAEQGLDPALFAGRGRVTVRDVRGVMEGE